MKTKTKYLAGLIVLLFIVLFGTLGATTSTNFDRAKQEIIFREIGHEILLYAGDSTSRVLPVKRFGNNEYQLTFENEFTFQPDALDSIIERAIKKNGLGRDYVVSVLNCNDTTMFYGYARSATANKNIMPCTGRTQPKNCYLINIKFEGGGINASQKGYLLGSLPFLALVGLLLYKKAKPVSSKAETGAIKIGSTLFDPKKRILIFNDVTTTLTGKEAKLLLIFASTPNEVLERKKLQKEIWEDEGVIVGRSLDMFISKLRRKLEQDNAIQLINIHGKGFKLEISF